MVNPPQGPRVTIRTASGDDEDGVTFTSPLIPGTTATVDVVASAAGLLSAWIDFNGDGDWTDAGEQVFQDHWLTAGTNKSVVCGADHGHRDLLVCSLPPERPVGTDAERLGRERRNRRLCAVHRHGLRRCAG